MRRILFAFMLMMLAACGDDPSPVEATLTLDLTNYAFVGGEDTWFYIVDEQGNPLSTIHATTPGKIEFKGQTDDDLITLVQIRKVDFSHYHYVSIFAGLKKNSTFAINAVSDSPAKPMYDDFVSLSVTNLPEVEDNILLASTQDFFEPKYPDDSEVEFGMVFFRNDAPIVLSVFNSDKEPSYTLLTGLTPGAPYVADVNTFTPYENVIALPDLDKLTYSLSGYNHDWEEYGTTFSSGQWSTSMSIPGVMGFLPGYAGYMLDVSVNSSTDLIKLVTNYRKRGSLPSSYTLPAFTSTVTNAMVTSPAFTFSRDFDYVHGFATHVPVGNAYVIAADVFIPKSFDLKLTTLPDEIVAAFPNVAFHELKLGFIDFTERLDDYTYEQMVTDYLGKHRVATYEYRNYEYAYF